MIDLIKNQIVGITGKPRDITAYQVWWLVSDLGLYPQLREALNAAQGRSIQPMPVAVAGDGIYEVLPPTTASKGTGESKSD